VVVGGDGHHRRLRRLLPGHHTGRITAGLIMGIGLLTLAVVTAQVASSFVTQAPSRVRCSPQAEPVTPQVALAELDRRLARIEQLLTATPLSERVAGAGRPES
jgi:hypothetical protein